MDKPIDWWKVALNTVEFINTASQAMDACNSAIGKKYEIDGVSKDVVNAFNYAGGTVMVTRSLEVANAIKEDYQHDSFRNTVETTASLTGEYIGASLGASAGADIGLKLGVGEKLGGVIGGLVGASLGATTCQKLAESICDANKLNIDQRKCRRCRCTFILRLYRGESEKDICDKCT